MEVNESIISYSLVCICATYFDWVLPAPVRLDNVRSKGGLESSSYRDERQLLSFVRGAGSISITCDYISVFHFVLSVVL